MSGNGAGLRILAAKTHLPQRRRDEGNSFRGDPGKGRADDRMIRRPGNGKVQFLRRIILIDFREPKLEPLLRVGHVGKPCQALVGEDALPVRQRGGEQVVDTLEVPVEAALGDAEPFGDARHGDGRDAAFGQALQRRTLPVAAAQTLAFAGGRPLHTGGY